MLGCTATYLGFLALAGAASVGSAFFASASRGLMGLRPLFSIWASTSLLRRPLGPDGDTSLEDKHNRYLSTFYQE